MAKIVLAWELGTALSYVGSFLPVAKQLRDQGHQVDYVLRELHNVQALLGQDPGRICQAPVWLAGSSEQDSPLTYADIMGRFGWSEAGSLMGLVKGWCALFEGQRPDLLVCSHAPTALLAARCMGIPAVQLGTGFLVPPRVSPMPPFRPWMQVDTRQLAVIEEKVLGSANAVLRAFAKPHMTSLSELFRGAEELLCTFEELDHYTRKEARYLGPSVNLEMGVEPVWPEGTGPRVFAYLNYPHRDYERIFDVLTAMRCRCLIFAPAVPPIVVQRFQTPSLQFSRHPYRLGSVAQQCDLAITNAGHATVAALLLHSVPMLLLPSHIEQFLLGMRVHNLGAGLNLNPEQPAPPYAAIFKELLENPTYPKKAREFADRYRIFDSGQQVSEVAKRILALV